MKKIKYFLIAVIAIIITSAAFFSSARIIRILSHKNTIIIYSRKYHLDPLLVAAIIMVESRFQPLARSHRGAIGLMQIMPETAKGIATNLKIAADQDSLRNPDVNIHIGCYYLRRLSKKYHGNLVLILAAYNAGPGRIDEWLTHNPDENLSQIPARQTRQYIGRVITTYHNLEEINRWIKIIPTN
jgi:soluble lytic murein transglycosylase